MTSFISSLGEGNYKYNYLQVKPSQAPRCAKEPDAIQREVNQEMKEIFRRVV